MRLPFFLLGLLAAFAAVAVAASPGPVVRSIEIRGGGASLVQPEVLRGQMQTRVGQPYSEKAVEEDLRQLQQMPGLQVSRIFGVPAADGVEIIVVVDPPSLSTAHRPGVVPDASPGSLSSLRAIAVGIGGPIVCWLLAAGLGRLFPRASAATRHLLWRLAFLAMAFCLLSALFPLELPIPVLPAPRSAPIPAAPLSLSDPASPAMPRIAFGPAGDVSHPLAAPVVDAHVPALWPHRFPWRDFFCALWLGGLVFFTLVCLAGTFRLRQILARTQPATAPVLDALWGELLSTHRLPAGTRLLLSAEVSTPLVTGLRQPVILLPAAAADWPAALLRASLLHEAAHLVRRDLWSAAFARAIAAAYWFHPCAWMSLRALQAEAEMAADDWVVVADAQPISYAETLVTLLRQLRIDRPAPGPAIGMLRDQGIAGRLARILDPACRRQPLPPVASRGLALAVAVLTAAVLVIHPVAADPRPGAPVAGEQSSAPAPFNLVGATDPTPRPVLSFLSAKDRAYLGLPPEHPEIRLWDVLDRLAPGVRLAVPVGPVRIDYGVTRRYFRLQEQRNPYGDFPGPGYRQQQQQSTDLLVAPPRMIFNERDR